MGEYKKTWTPKPKLDEVDWKKIKFENSLGPQIGGLIHDATALAIASMSKETNGETLAVMVKDNLDTLYEIAEQKKSQILKDQEPKQLTNEQVEEAQNRGKKILEQENQEEKEGLDNANYEINEVSRNSGGTIPF